MTRFAGYAYDGTRSGGRGELERWVRLAPWKQRAVLRAVAQGELTLREIAREFGCSHDLVGVARKLGGLTPGSAKPVSVPDGAGG